jgi:uncharacterized protein YbaR (Trm112 family)
MPTTALEVKRVSHSEDLLHPGEFVFIPKREPIRRFHSEPIEPPADKYGGTMIGDAFRYLKWRLFGPKYEIKQIVELLWPEIDTVIINCPDCNQPLATTRNHTIVSLEPLTIETALTCPYSKTHTFKVAEGKIITA